MSWRLNFLVQISSTIRWLTRHKTWDYSPAGWTKFWLTHLQWHLLHMVMVTFFVPYLCQLSRHHDVGQAVRFWYCFLSNLMIMLAHSCTFNCYCCCCYYNNNYYYYYCFTTPWTSAGTTQVSWYQRGKTRKVTSIWIYWSKRYCSIDWQWHQLSDMQIQGSSNQPVDRWIQGAD